MTIIVALSACDGRECAILVASVLPSIKRRATKQGNASVEPTSITGTILGCSTAAERLASDK